MTLSPVGTTTTWLPLLVGSNHCMPGTPHKTVLEKRRPSHLNIPISPISTCSDLYTCPFVLLQTLQELPNLSLPLRGAIVHELINVTHVLLMLQYDRLVITVRYGVVVVLCWNVKVEDWLIVVHGVNYVIIIVHYGVVVLLGVV